MKIFKDFKSSVILILIFFIKPKTFPKFFLLVVLCLALARPAGGQVLGATTPAFVQGNAVDVWNESSVTVTFSSNVTSGNLIAADVFVNKQGKTLNNITATCVSGNFTLVNNPTALTTVSYSAMGYGVINSSGPCTVTVTLSGASGNTLSMAIQEISGINISSPLDGSTMQSQSGPGTGSNAITSGNITTTQNGDYIFGVVNHGSNDYQTAGTGYTVRVDDTLGMKTEDQIQSSAGSIAATFTDSQGWDSLITGIMAFKPAIVAVTPPPSDTIPPSVPTNLSASAVSQSQINLSWTASTDNVGVTGYKIYRAGSQIGTSATNSYSDAGLTASTQYTYTVSAYDTAGNNSAQSASSSVTTQSSGGGGIPTLVFSDSLAANSEPGNNFKIVYGGSMGGGTLANNLLTVRITAPHGSSVSSIVDNQGSTYTLGASTDSGSGGWITSLYYVAGVKAGVTQITVNYSAAVAEWHAAVEEYSGVATVSPTDASCSNHSTTISCLLTTTGQNDLVVASTIASSGAELYQNSMSTVTPGAGFILDAADTQSSDADEEATQASPGSITPSFTITGNSQTFNIVAMAFKSAAAGTQPTGMHILHIQQVQINTAKISQNVYFVSSGNLLVADSELGPSFSTYNISGCSLANTWVKRTLGSYWPQFFYLPASGSFSTNLHCTLTNTGGGNNAHLVIYDIAGAAISPEDVDSATAEGNGGFVAGPNFTPTTAPGIVIGAASDGTGPVTNVESGGIFDNTVYTGETDQGQLNNGDAWQHLFYNSKSQISLTWTMQNSGSYMEASAIAFKAASSGGGTTLSAPSITSSLSASASVGTTFSYQITASNNPTSYSATNLPGGLSLNTSTGLISGTATTAGTTNITIGATNSGGMGTATLVVMVSASDTTTPSTPTSLSPTAVSSTQINLSWTASTDSVGVIGYKIFRNGSQVGTSATNSYFDIGLSPSTQYTYTVSAYDAAGNNSSQSSSASATTQAQQTGAYPWSGIIATSRATNWSQAGVTGGIPSGNWTQCATAACNTLSTPANVTAANINTAIAGAPDNTYVQLPAGNFTMSTGLVWNHKSKVVLRGQGANTTHLIFNGNNICQGTSAAICFESSDTNYWGGPSNIANWTGNYAAGTTSIILSSVANLQVGSPITLDQTDDLSNADTGGVFVCYTPAGVCSSNGDSGGAPRIGRSEQQIVNVTSISGSGPYTVGISPAIVMPNWVASKTPQAWWAAGPVFYDGLENLSINAGSSEAITGLNMFNCTNCWESGVASIGAWGRSHVMIFQSNHDTVQNNYFYLTNSNASVNYGVETIPSSDSLIQNNIFQAVQAPYPSTGSCTGCVYSYNFDVNDLFSPYTWQNDSGFPHAVGDDHILYEGNIGAGIYSDNFHGTHQFQTIFRNYWDGYQKNNGTFTTGDTIPLIIDAFSRFYNIIGNVIGNAAVQNTYEDTVTDQHSGSVPIYSVGYGDEIPNDANTVTTLMRWGNYDVITNTARFAASEVPSGLTGVQAPFANPVPSSHSLPPSFYLSSRPSWWPSTKAWPSIGPDITGGNVSYCKGGKNTGTYVLSSNECPGGTATVLAAGRIISNPAMDCYLNTMGGTPDGTGPALTFNAANCYPLTIAVNSNMTETTNFVLAGNTNTYTIGGNVSGLSGTLVLQDNGGDTYSTSSSGSFNFSIASNSGANYAVTVLTQPTSQTCIVTNGNGIVSSANVTNISVSCANNDASNNESAQSTVSVATTQTAISSGGGGGSASGGESSSYYVAPSPTTTSPSDSTTGCNGTTGFSITTGQSCANNIISTTTKISIPGCGNQTIGFSTTTGQSCANNIPSSTPSYDFGATTLKLWSTGPAVKELQRYLNNTLNLGLVLDAILGPKTIVVIKKWQTTHGLTPDGLIGPKTKAMMLVLME